MPQLKLPRRFGFMADTMAQILTVLRQHPVAGSWPTQAQVSTELEVTLAAKRRSRQFADIRQGQLRLTNLWPFDITPEERLVVAYLAATAYDAHLDRAADKVTNSKELWGGKLTTVELAHLRPYARGNTSVDQELERRAQAAAESLFTAWHTSRMANRLPRIAAYFNVMVALNISGSTEVNAMSLFLHICGGDWVKPALFNSLFDTIVDKTLLRQRALGIHHVTEAEIRQHLTNIDVTVSTFTGLDNPWGPEDAPVARAMVVDLARYLMAAGAESQVMNFNANPEDSAVKDISPKSKFGRNVPPTTPGPGDDEDQGKADRPMPQMLQDLLDEADIAEAVSNILESEFTDEQAVGTQAGFDSADIVIDHHRPPTGPERIHADGIAAMLAHFTNQSRSGEVRYDTEGRVSPLDWYIKRQVAPGDLGYRIKTRPNRRHQFSLALALMTDSSGSMSGTPIKLVSSLLWTWVEAIRRAHRLGAPVYVWTASFNTTWAPVHCPAHQVPILAAQGGTNPTKAIEAGDAWLLSRPVKHRLMVSFTDGYWSSNATPASGVKHVLFDTSGATTQEGWEVHHVTSPEEVLPITRDALRQLFVAQTNQFR